VHAWLRAICRCYPFPFGDDWLNRRFDRFFASDAPRWLEARGNRRWPTMVFDVSDNLQRKFYYFPRLYWYYAASGLHSYLPARLRPGQTFVDIGANVGFFALLAARLVGACGRVYAFEPDPISCESLERSVHANGWRHVHPFRIALSDHRGEAPLFRAKFGTATSLLPEAPGREGRYGATLRAQLRTLDELVAHGELDPERIAAIKIDVEGEEARTIAGMHATLEAARYPPLWCEVRGPLGSTRAPDTYRAVRDQLVPFGYQPFAWAKGKRRPLADRDVERRMDVLFERAS